MRRVTILSGPITFALLWLAFGSAGLLNPLFIPTLPDVAIGFNELAQNGMLFRDIYLTSIRTLVGFCGAALTGVPLGLLIASLPRVERGSIILLDFFRSIPGIAMFPVFLLFFGIGDSSKIANVIFASGLIIVINTMYGVKNASAVRLSAARTMGASPRAIFWRVTLPSALPAIVGGLRIAISISLIVVVVTEMFVGSDAGLGKRIFSSYQLFHIPEMYANILMTGFLGYFLNVAIALAESHLVHWGGR